MLFINVMEMTHYYIIPFSMQMTVNIIMFTAIGEIITVNIIMLSAIVEISALF